MHCPKFYVIKMRPRHFCASGRLKGSIQDSTDNAHLKSYIYAKMNKNCRLSQISINSRLNKSNAMPHKTPMIFFLA